MSARLQSQADAGLPTRSVIKPAPPVREVNDPPALRRGVYFGPIFMPLVGAGGQNHARRDLKWRVEMLELGNHVPLEMLARFGAHIEGRDEKAPILETVSEIGDVFGLELEEELTD